MKQCKPLAARSVNTLNRSLNRGFAVVSAHIGKTVGGGMRVEVQSITFLLCLNVQLCEYLTSNTHVFCSFSYTTRSYTGKTHLCFMTEILCSLIFYGHYMINELRV